MAGLATTLGSGAMTNSIQEIENADVILVTGSNTTETHPVIATHIKRAVLFNNAKLIVVDPRKIDLTRFATVWLRQNNGTDVAWINGLINAIITGDMQDTKFIAEQTENYEAMKETVSKYTPEFVEQITGIPAADLLKAAEIYGKGDKGSIAYAMGITQHSNGTDNVKSLANLAMVTGNIGRESTGVNPLRGQNNVQGACDMGALPNVYPGYQKVVEEASQKKFEKAWGTKLSGELGLTIGEMMEGACKGDLKAIMIMGENPVVSDPNITHVKKALESLDLLIVQDIFMTETAKLADVVLPAASFAEKDGHFTNTERRVLPINILTEQVGQSRPDWEIIQDIANAMDAGWHYDSIKDILDEINHLSPHYGGITYKRIQKGERLQWPCPTPDHPGTQYLHKGKFIRGKGLFSEVHHMDPKEMPCDEYPFVMSTGRSLYHYHTGTMTRKTKALTQYVPNAYVEMCCEDINKLGVEDGEKVRVSSRRGTIDIAVKATEKVRAGNIFIPFHFAEAAANMLTNDVVDPVSKIPEYKVCAVNIEKISASNK